MRLFLLAAFALLPLYGEAPGEDCRKLYREGKRQEVKACFTKLASSGNPWQKAEGRWGLRQFGDANDAFKAALAAQPKSALLRARWGLFFLERYNPGEARQLFKEAIELDATSPEAWYGMALAGAESFESKAIEYAERAIQARPGYVAPQELLARLALEDSNPKKAVEEADKAMAVSPLALDAMAVRAAVDLLANKGSTEWFDRIAKINPSYGEAYALVAHLFVLNRRYEEGIAMYRKALDLNPDLDAARSQLGINLMRLGREEDAKQQLEKAYNAGYQSDATVNSLRLIDSYARFQTFKTPATIVKLDKKEAELLKPYVEGELLRAISTFEKKYKLKLPTAVQVEVYPNHDDFAVRTLGMPGLGALGVTFGPVVAMDSPSGRPPGRFHWASTLWHELSHVFVLNATKHLAPRWFTEGMAVHEETAISPDWGDRLDPEAITAIREKKLLPVAQLDRGFVRPSYPSQVVVSYFQAGRICDFIASKWTYDKLLAMMHDFGKGKSTAEVVKEQLGMEPAAFDKVFLPWLEAQTKTAVDGYPEWRKRIRGLTAASKAGRHDDVIKEGLELLPLYPDYVEQNSVYEMVADAHEAKGDRKSAVMQLSKYSSVGGRNPEVLLKLAKWQEEAGAKKDAIRTLERLIFVYPMGEQLHQQLGRLYLAEGDTAGAIREYRALVAANPIDQAESRYNLAKALSVAKRMEEAKEQLLMALEEAPGYKPAQRLLLELSR